MSQFLVLLVGQVEVDHAGLSCAQRHLDDVDGLEVGVGAAKDAEDCLLIPAAEDGSDPAVALHKEDEGAGREVLDRGANAGHGWILGEAKAKTKSLVVDGYLTPMGCAL